MIASGFSIRYISQLLFTIIFPWIFVITSCFYSMVIFFFFLFHHFETIIVFLYNSQLFQKKLCFNKNHTIGSLVFLVWKWNNAKYYYIKFSFGTNVQDSISFEFTVFLDFFYRVFLDVSWNLPIHNFYTRFQLNQNLNRFQSHYVEISPNMKDVSNYTDFSRKNKI